MGIKYSLFTSFEEMAEIEVPRENEEIEVVENTGPEFVVPPELFGKWSYDNFECSDISLRRYLQLREPKQRVFLPFTAGRYQKRRFKKASCPLVERLTNMMMTSGHRNNGSKQRAVRIIQQAMEIINLLTGLEPVQVLVTPSRLVVPVKTLPESVPVVLSVDK